jgi:hypothetical protein
VETAVTFPGLPAIVPSARRFVRGVLAGRGLAIVAALADKFGHDATAAGFCLRTGLPAR